MPFNDCSNPPTPEERRRRPAALLATGLLRLGSALRPPPSPASSGPERASESSVNRSADSGEKSVAGRPVNATGDQRFPDFRGR
jgi:hypothetical protein